MVIQDVDDERVLVSCSGGRRYSMCKRFGRPGQTINFVYVFWFPNTCRIFRCEWLWNFLSSFSLRSKSSQAAPFVNRRFRDFGRLLKVTL